MCETKLLWDISLVWQCRFHLFFYTRYECTIQMDARCISPDISNTLHFSVQSKTGWHCRREAKARIIENSWIFIQNISEAEKKGWSSMASYFQVVGTLETCQGCICNKHGHVAPGCGHSMPLVDVEDVHSSTQPCSWWDRNHTWKKLHDVLWIVSDSTQRPHQIRLLFLSRQ